MAHETESSNGDLKLVQKHPRAIRWMHWVNFPVLTIMIWSGLLIYWGDSIPPYQHAHQVYRIGIGHWTLVRLFPDWFWKLLNAPYQLTTGLGWHFLFMWVFAINGIAYAIYLAVSGEWRVLWPQRRSFKDALIVTLYDLHIPFARRQGMPPQGKYNGAQRIAYSAIVLMGAGSLITGLAIYKPTEAHWLTQALGGYEMARWFHFWLTMSFCGFFLVHVGQVIMAGWNNFRSMVSGYEIQQTLGTAALAVDVESGEPTGAAGNAGAAGLIEQGKDKMDMDGDRIECRACGAKSLQPYVSKNGFDVLRCSRCGFGQVPVTQEDLDRLYEESYWSGETTANFGQVAGQQITPTYIYWIKQQLQLLAGQPAPLRVLEIGPGIAGMLADYLRREHPEVEYEAIEISEMAVAQLIAGGFKVHQGGITSPEIVTACQGRFDLVLGMEVIEHDPDPRGFARAVHAMLRPGGWCAFTTGNLDGWIARWKKADWYYIDPPVHVSYYTPKVFRTIYAQEGFDRTSVQRYGFNYIALKLRTRLPGILVLTDLSGVATGMVVCARRA